MNYLTASAIRSLKQIYETREMLVRPHKDLLHHALACLVEAHAISYDDQKLLSDIDRDLGVSEALNRVRVESGSPLVDLERSKMAETSS
ncbi:MAG: hypothetical protein AAFU68_02890 [Pseudomonadota bacterium]